MSLRLFLSSLFSCLRFNPWCLLVSFPQCSEAQKLLNIAKELLHTEEAYVKRLNLLDQVTTRLCAHLFFLCMCLRVCQLFGCLRSKFQSPKCASGLSD